MKDFLLNAITKAMNTYLKMDPESHQRLSQLQDKTISIELLPMHLIFQCTFTKDGIQINPAESVTTDTKIRGTPLQMVGAMLTKDRQRFFADDLTIEGNAEIAQQAINVFDALEIDWEEYLSHFVGDAPAHHIGQFIKNVNNWVKNTKETFVQNMSEYVHEEVMWFPQREALDDFFKEIDTVRMDVDRLEARVNSLLNTVHKSVKDHEERK